MYVWKSNPTDEVYIEYPQWIELIHTLAWPQYGQQPPPEPNPTETHHWDLGAAVCGRRDASVLWVQVSGAEAAAGTEGDTARWLTLTTSTTTAHVTANVTLHLHCEATCWQPSVTFHLVCGASCASCRRGVDTGWGPEGWQTCCDTAKGQIWFLCCREADGLHEGSVKMTPLKLICGSDVKLPPWFDIWYDGGFRWFKICNISQSIICL